MFKIISSIRKLEPPKDEEKGDDKHGDKKEEKGEKGEKKDEIGEKKDNDKDKDTSNIFKDITKDSTTAALKEN